MVQEMAPVRRLGAVGKMARRKADIRPAAGRRELRRDWGEEGVSRERIRQIVSEVLQKRAVDSGADHAKLQLDRLARVMQFAAEEAIAAGDVAAITPSLKVLDRLDRYQTVASANQVYDDGTRQKLLDKINRIAADLGVDEVMARRCTLI